MAIEIFKMEDVNAIAAENRRFLYRREADPMFMQVQRGEITNDEWEAKVQEIKDRFPYVSEDLSIDVYYETITEETETIAAQETQNGG